MKAFNPDDYLYLLENNRWLIQSSQDEDSDYYLDDPEEGSDYDLEDTAQDMYEEDEFDV